MLLAELFGPQLSPPFFELGRKPGDSELLFKLLTQRVDTKRILVTGERQCAAIAVKAVLGRIDGCFPKA